MKENSSFISERYDIRRELHCDNIPMVKHVGFWYFLMEFYSSRLVASFFSFALIPSANELKIPRDNYLARSLYAGVPHADWLVPFYGAGRSREREEFAYLHKTCLASLIGA